jgi:hypothetical protein
MMRILDNFASYMCPHGGQVTVITANTRVKAEGARYLLRVTDTFLVAGCAFNVSGVPSPCIRVMWLNQSIRVKVMGSPVLLESSIGLCQNAAGVPQGPVVVMGPQNRAKAL